MIAFVAVGGELEEPERFTPLARVAGLVLAADSGYEHMRRMGVRPHLLVGDLDSISPDALREARDDPATRIETFPPEKDQTDTEIALRLAVTRGAGIVLVVGAFGLRLDHALANVLLLASPALRETDVRLLDPRQEVRLVRGRVRLRTTPGELVSLLPVGGDATGVTTTGLAYALDGATLGTGPALGVSNVATGDEICVRVGDGSLLLTRLFAGGLNAERYVREEMPGSDPA